MEKKTNLSEEFGGSSNFSSREFSTDRWKLDPKTDLSPELNRPRIPDSLEFSGASSSKEFSSVSNEPVTTPKPPRLEHHRRTLLLQTAALGLSAVVVTNSLGMDVLGDDMLFPDSINEYIAVHEVVDESRYDEDGMRMLDTTSYVIHSSDKAEENPGPYGDSVWYDEASNTLYLDGLRTDQLHIECMENDVTIFVESTSYIGLLTFSGSNITISGNQDVSLFINMHTREHWWYGMILYGEGDDAALTISPGVTVNVRGTEGAIAVDNTVANPGICFDESQTFVSGSLQSGTFPFSSGNFVDGGEADWTIVDDSGNIARHVIFAPIGLDDYNMYSPMDALYGWPYEDESAYNREYEGQFPQDWGQGEDSEEILSKADIIQDFINEHPELWVFGDESLN